MEKLLLHSLFTHNNHHDVVSVSLLKATLKVVVVVVVRVV